MKHSVVLLIVIAAASVEASAQTYGLDNTNPAVFSKFRIPKTELNALQLGSYFNYYSNKYANLYPSGSNYDAFSSNLLYSLSPKYYLLNESDDKYLAVALNAYGDYRNSFSNSEGPGIPVNNYSKSHYDNLSVSADAVYRNYAPGSDLFYSLGSDAQLNVNEYYNDLRASDTTRQKVYSSTKSQNYSFSVGIGLGKMRNVTSVVSAIRFQERMKQLNLISSNLSEKTIEDLAEQFYREGYYSQVHVRSDKFFWEDVEKTLSTDGISLSGLNQYADSYLREVPDELRFMRHEGIVGGIGLRVNYANTYGSPNYYPNGISEELFTMANVYLDFSHQLNLNSQLAFSASASGGPNLTKNSDVKQMYEINSVIGYSYELTDRIVASASNTFDVIFQNSVLKGRGLSNSSGLSMNYFIEDNVTLSASYSWNYSDSKAYNSSWHTRGIYNYVTVGVTYYLQRGLMMN